MSLFTRIFSRRAAVRRESDGEKKQPPTPREGGILWPFFSSNTALCVATVYRCVKLLSESVAALPVQVMRRKGGIFIDEGQIRADVQGCLGEGPITIAQGQVRGMIDGVPPYDDLDTYLPRTLAALKRMESLIGEILTVSRMQAANEITQVKVDLTSLLNNRIDESRELLDVREIPLVTSIDRGLFCDGNAELISMAVGAFLSNAVFYSSEGSKLTVNAHEENGCILTEIRNT